MIVIQCDKCYEPYGCETSYKWNDKNLSRLCQVCNFAGLCDRKSDETIIKGLCPDCIRQGGGL